MFVFSSSSIRTSGRTCSGSLSCPVGVRRTIGSSSVWPSTADISEAKKPGATQLISTRSRNSRASARVAASIAPFVAA